MSKKFSRSDALERISTWSTADVLCLIRKNGLEQCCKAIAKRKIDGDELLHLTEGKLALWKSDLTRPLIWCLWTFVEEVKRTPEKYLEEKIVESHGNEDHLSDTGSWGTDFEDETNEESIILQETRKIKSNIEKNKTDSSEIADGFPKVEDEGTYANCGAVSNDESTYANFQESIDSPLKNISRLHGQSQKSLAEQLKEQLKLRNAAKPMVRPKKPETLQLRRIDGPPPAGELHQPQKSFLHNGTKAKSIVPSQTQKRMAVPPPPEPNKCKNQPMIIEKSNKDQEKPPMTIRTLDLVANLPTRTEESEDEYETFDEQIMEQNQKKNISRVDSKQSLTSGHQSSVESVYKPASITSHEEEDEPSEIYESITETPDDDYYYLSRIQSTANSETPPSLPAKLQPSPTPSPTGNRSKTNTSKVFAKRRGRK